MGMIKLAFIPRLDEHDEPTARTIWTPDGNETSIIKMASSVKYAAELQKAISDIKPTDKHTYKLVTALPASDWWGGNRNGDWFFRNALMLPGPDYGHQSFLSAGLYRHHCFPAGTEVLMADRQRRPIEQVVEGDEVVTLDGIRKVTKTMRRAYNGSGVRLTLKGKRNALVGTCDHPVKVFRRKQIHCRHNYSRLGAGHACVELKQPIGDPQWLPLSEVMPGDYLVFPKPRLGEVEVPKPFAELVGWVAAEGHLGARGAIQFTFAEDNLADQNAVIECLQANGLRVTVTPRPQHGLVMLSACSVETHKQLSRYVVGVKAEKQLTGEILSWCPDSLLRMLGAYVSGDGHVPTSGKNRGLLRIRSSSPAMLDILSDVLHGLDIPCAVNMDGAPGPMVSPTNGQTYDGNGSGCVSVPAAYSPLITKYSRKGFYRCGRVNERLQFGDVYLVRVTDAEQIDLNEDVFNLEVAGPNHYVAEGVVVHNCNKDPNLSLGKVLFAYYDAFMHRVMLILDYFHELLEKFDSLDLLQREWPDYSMAAKVPFDVCFPPGTLVRTATGHVPIEMVQVGDVVRSHTGAARRVLKTMQRPGADSVTVHAAGVPATTPTANHPYLVLRREDVRSCQGSANKTRLRHQPTGECCRRCGKPLSWKPAWVAAADLHVGDYLLTPVDECGGVSGDPAMAKVLGYYLGDGHIIKQRSRRDKSGPYKDMGFSITVGTDSPEHLANVVEALSGRFRNEPNVYDMGAGRHAVAVNVYDQVAAAWLQAHGGRTSTGKHLSEEVFGWSREEKLSLLGGYVDTDGCVDNRGSVRISTVNRGLALDTQRLLHSIGVPASVGGGGMTPLGAPTYNVFIPASVRAALGGYSWKVGILDNAPTAATQSFFWGGYWCTPVISVEEAPAPETVYNLSVECDESYVVEGVAVHNCTVCGDLPLLRAITAKAGATTPADEVKAILDHMKAGNLIRGVATKREHYCDHLKYMMNKVLTSGPDQGKQVGAINTHPKFFDLSEVTTGADSIAKEIRKLAAAGMVDDEDRVISGAELAEHFGYSYGEQAPDCGVRRRSGLCKMGGCGCKHGMQKAAALEDHAPYIVQGVRGRVKQALLETKASLEQRAEMRKVIDASGVPLSVSREMPIPNEKLMLGPLAEVLSTLGGLGIVLNPMEFQTLVLSHLGQPSLASGLSSSGAVFPPAREGLEPPIGPEFVNKRLLQAFLPYAENRSCLAPMAAKRTYIIIVKEAGVPTDGMFPRAPAAPEIPEFPVIDMRKLSTSQGETLRKVASLYRGYREVLASQVVPLVRCTCEHPEVLEALRGSPFAGELAKEAAAPAELVALGSLFPLMYLYAAHLRKEEREGDRLGMIRSFISKHPVLSAGAILGMLKSLKQAGGPTAAEAATLLKP